MLIFCPSCQRQLRIPDESAGQRVKCPSCQHVFSPAPAATGEEIQAPPAPKPMPSAAPGYDDRDERRPRSSRGRDSEIDLLIAGGDPEEALRRARAAAMWFFIAAVVTMALAIVDIIKSVAVGELADMEQFEFDPEMGIAFISAVLICCGGLLIALNLLLMIAGVQLRSLASKGWVITGIVAAFAQALVFGSSALVEILMVLFDADEAFAKWTPLSIVFDCIIGFFNCFAGVRAIMALNDPAVSAEYNRNSSRRRRHVRWED